MRVIFAYKNFASFKGISHIGLGVAGQNTAKVLNENEIIAEVWPIVDSNNLRQLLNLEKQKHLQDPYYSKVTHVVISAPWIETHALMSLCQRFPGIQFSVNCHSNVGFLQADPNGMRLVREGLELEMVTHNFNIAANSKKMAKWIEDAYGSPCAYLPNLYFLHHLANRHRVHWHLGTPIRIGCFGAIRPQKNLASAVAAAVEISHQFKTKAEVWISSGRTEGGATTVLNTVREMCRNLPNIELKEAGWHTWPSFRRLVGSMHLLLQPSHTESFNLVTADGVAEGVPSVVGEAITWVPSYWKANVDDVFDIARVGRTLLMLPDAAADGMHSLKEHNRSGIEVWKSYLKK